MPTFGRERGHKLEDQPIRVLLIEDNDGDVRLIQEMLVGETSQQLAFSHEARLGLALQRLADESFDAIVSDLSLPDAQGLEALSRLQAHTPDLPVVVLTGLCSQDLALEAVRHGAQDYLVKGQFDGNLLARAVCYAIERKQIQAALTQARSQLEWRVEERTAQLEATNQTLEAEIAERTRAERALRDLNEHLEQRVLERTVELTEANAQLQREIEERKRTARQLLRRNRELLSLQTALAATAASLDHQFVLDTVTWEMTNLLEVDGCTIFEWEPDADTLAMVAQYPPSHQGQEEETEVHSLAGYPLRNRVLAERSAQQITTGHGETDPGELTRMKKAGVRALLVIPMLFQDRVVGLLEMRTCQVDRAFTDHEISLAHLLANQAASAIENAKLYERARHEITRRKEAEEGIKASLREKEVLLKEIHHRVKNNLQVVSSLLYLQSERISDPAVLGMLQDSRSRIRSMALVHERLYQAQDLSRIDFSAYVLDLANHLLGSYCLNPSAVTLEVIADDVVLDVNTAVPCGLIINELVSNSLKHAFPSHSTVEADCLASAGGHREGGPWRTTDSGTDKIRIELRMDADGQLQLLVADSGVGFPETLDFHNTESLGLLLVNSLVRQLRGTAELNRQNGTEFKIMFSVQ